MDKEDFAKALALGMAEGEMGMAPWVNEEGFWRAMERFVRVWLVGWLVVCMVFLVGWLVGWLVGCGCWLFGCMVFGCWLLVVDCYWLLVVVVVLLLVLVLLLWWWCMHFILRGGLGWVMFVAYSVVATT